jgi:hypothetical protein
VLRKLTPKSGIDTMTFKIPINANSGPCAKDLRCLAAPKNCLLTLFLALASGLAAAVTQPCNLTAAEFTSMNGDFSADVHAVRNYESAMAGMLKAEKFEQLDCLADHARSGKERLPGGAWKLYLLYGGLWDPVQYPVTHATREDWNAFAAPAELGDGAPTVRYRSDRAG